MRGRVGSVSEGAGNAAAWIFGTARQPSVSTHALPDANCAQCHADFEKTSDFDLHAHRYLKDWQAKDPQAATCAGCHTSHTTDGNAAIGYLEQQRTLKQCQQCHVALGVKQ